MRHISFVYFDEGDNYIALCKNLDLKVKIEKSPNVNIINECNIALVNAAEEYAVQSMYPQNIDESKEDFFSDVLMGAFILIITKVDNLYDT